MYSYSLLLLAVILAAVSSTTTTTTLTTTATLRGSSSSSQTQEQSHHRRLVEEVTCKLFLQDVAYKPTKVQPNGYSEEGWICVFPLEESSRVGVNYVELADYGFENATSGRSTLSTSQAIIDMATVTMYLPAGAKIKITTEDDQDDRGRNRNLAASIGTLETIMVRVIDSKGVQPTASTAQLRNDVFEDKVCLKSQYEACSYDKLKIEPFSNEVVSNGIFDLQIDFDISQNNDWTLLKVAAIAAFQAQFGSLYGSEFGLVMFCMPPGSDSSIVGDGVVNGPFSFYNNEWCGSVSAHMHEIGHNLNLDHSGDEESNYNDRQGFMGVSYLEDDTKMCYNAAKSFQLGWYDDQVKTVDPLNKNNPVQRFVLNGVSDYQKNKEALIVLRLDQTSMTPDYYIGYNRKDGINQDTKIDPDFVTILRKDTEPDQFGQSTKVAKLPIGESYVIENFNGQRDVRVTFFGAKDDRDIYVDIIDVEYAPDDEKKPCEQHTIVIKTDNYPSDTTWTLAEIGGMGKGFGSNPDYTEVLTEYSTELCLPYDTEYKFTIFDGFGDGLCCQQGKGFYRIIDSDGNEVVPESESEGEFDEKDITFGVGSDPNPNQSRPTQKPANAPTVSPTKFPTLPPTNGPLQSPTGPCENYTVEIMTDGNPGDTSWSILLGETTKELYRSDAMKNTYTKYTTEDICLEYNTNYKFVIADSYKDGICCGQGNGSYRVLDSKNNIVIDSGNIDEDFEIKEITIEIGAPALKEDKECKDGTKKIKFVKKNGKKSKKKKCKKLARANKCDSVYKKGFVWEYCPKACNRCDDL